MPKGKLERLINSLSTAEKRNFTIYANRSGANSNSKFVRLYDLLLRGSISEKKIILKLSLNKGSYANLRQHLFRELLTSLRLIYIDKEIDIELREQIDFTRILYGKGQYLDALQLLERAKGKAIKHGQDILHLEILEFQKLIEARHITYSRKVTNKMDFLLNESSTISRSMLNTSELLNMNIQIHGRYIERGHSRSPEEVLENAAFWQEIQTKRADAETNGSTFHQLINRMQATMWYNYIQLNLEDTLEAARDAIGLFNTSKQMIVKDPDLYLRCMYYMAVFSYLTNGAKDLKRYLDRMDTFLNEGKVKLNENSQQIGHTYFHLSQYNHHFLNGEWEAAYTLSAKVHQDYEAGTFRPNNQRWGLLLYKSAMACFLTLRFDEAIDYLNEVDNMQGGILREDLLINTRLLHAICNFELENFHLADVRLTNLKRLLKNSRDTAEVHLLTAATLRRLLSLPKPEHRLVYKEMRERMSEVVNDQFERKAIAYFDPNAWLDIHL